MILKTSLLIVLYLTIFLYFPLNKQYSEPIFKLKFDGKIPLIKQFIWFYIVYFIFLSFTPLLLWRNNLILPYLISATIAETIGIIFWVIIPNSVVRPAIKSNKTLTDKILNLTYRVDKDSNGLPSGHVFQTCVCGYYLCSAYPSYTPIIISISFAIILSTLYTKQHYILDVLAGFIVAIFAIMILNSTYI